MKDLITLLQSNHYTGSFKRLAEWLLKIAATVLCIWFISKEIHYKNLQLLPYVRNVGFLMTIFLVFGMMLVNWFLEAEKWRISIPDEKLTFREALNTVLSGLALNWVIPFTLGDAGGRLTNVRNYSHVCYALIINRSIMILVTSIYGAFSVLFYFNKLNSMTFLGVILAGFLISFLYVTLNRKKVNGAMPNAILRKVFQLSLLRYFIFSFQFYLLIEYFNPSLAGFVVVLGIGWIFLFRSFVPSLFGNFGVREASALVFFQSFMEEASLILLPCLLIWFINTIVPSILGAITIFKLKVNIAQ